MNDQNGTRETLDFSLLIATRDRAEQLESTLEKLRQQEVAGLRWELIVIDNGSVDETQAVLHRAAVESDLPLVFLHEPAPGKSAALNSGLEIARGQLLVFSDDDITPSPQWLAELCRASRQWTEYGVFAGTIDPIYPANLPDWFDTATNYTRGAFAKFRLKQSEGPLAYGVLPFGGNFAVRTGAMNGIRFSTRLGPQNGEFALGDDLEIVARLFANGERGVYVPSASVSHSIEMHQISVKWLLQRALRVGRGFARLENDKESLRMFGVPWYLWSKLLLVWTRYQLRKFKGPGARAHSGWILNLCRGRIHEYRVMARENTALHKNHSL